MATNTATVNTFSPQTDPRKRFIELQQKLLDYYHVKALSRFVKLKRPDMTAHVLEAGQGETLVAVHGGDGEAVNWAPFLAKLQGRFHIYAVDRPGFGLSDACDYRSVNLRAHAADFIRSLLDALGIERASLMGGSMGGFFCLAAALAAPGRVMRLVLTGMPVGLVRSLPLPLRLICGIPGASRLFMNSRPSLESQKQQYRRMFHTDPSIVPELFFQTRLAGLALLVERDTWAVLLRRVAGLRGTRRDAYLGDELEKLKPPTLLIWGEHDMAPAALGEQAAKRIPHREFAYLKGIGHFPFLEAGDVCRDLILDFVAHNSAPVAGSQ